jgi:hypothetical protein
MLFIVYYISSVQKLYPYIAYNRIAATALHWQLHRTRPGYQYSPNANPNPIAVRGASATAIAVPELSQCIATTTLAGH